MRGFDLSLVSQFLPRWYFEISVLLPVPVEHRAALMCCAVVGSLKAPNGSTDFQQSRNHLKVCKKWIRK